MPGCGLDFIFVTMLIINSYQLTARRVANATFGNGFGNTDFGSAGCERSDAGHAK